MIDSGSEESRRRKSSRTRIELIVGTSPKGTSEVECSEVPVRWCRETL